MSKEVCITSYGNTEYLAKCCDCGFEANFETKLARNPSDVRRLAREHVVITGHCVIIEKAYTSAYRPIAVNKKKE